MIFGLTVKLELFWPNLTNPPSTSPIRPSRTTQPPLVSATLTQARGPPPPPPERSSGRFGSNLGLGDCVPLNGEVHKQHHDWHAFLQVDCRSDNQDLVKEQYSMQVVLWLLWTFWVVVLSDFWRFNGRIGGGGIK